MQGPQPSSRRRKCKRAIDRPSYLNLATGVFVRSPRRGRRYAVDTPRFGKIEYVLGVRTQLRGGISTYPCTRTSTHSAQPPPVGPFLSAISVTGSNRCNDTLDRIQFRFSVKSCRQKLFRGFAAVSGDGGAALRPSPVGFRRQGII